MTIELTSTIIKFKKRLFDELSLRSEDYKLVCEGKELEENLTFAAQKVHNLTVLDYIPINYDDDEVESEYFEEEEEIYVLFAFGEGTVGLEVEPSTEVESLKKMVKEKIEANSNQPLGEFELEAKGEIMEEGKKLGSYKIKPMEKLRVVQGILVVSDSMKKEIQISLDSTIQQLKEAINKEFSLPVESQSLTFNYVGENPQDSSKLRDCGLRIGSNVEVTKKADDSIEVMVKDFSNNIFNLNLKESDKILDVKGWISERIGKSVENIRLSHGGVQMQDNKTVGNYKVKDKDTLNIMGRLRGGANIY